MILLDVRDESVLPILNLTAWTDETIKEFDVKPDGIPAVKSGIERDLYTRYV
ncbi:hypothetical protein [Bacillus thuringiensis]|uniref:hypothetical protein n=1 Tax=Bacillus thuringiensis TaxID=1428 RepID=UPI0015D5164F|nr:hypothetical protein [Bacillus thuringiensis]